MPISSGTRSRCRRSTISPSASPPNTARDGYVLSRAIVPVQELDPNGAVVRIQVVEGYIETVEWPAQLAGYRDFFSYYAARITAERPVNIRTIERYLLLAGDLPGLKFKNSLKPHPTKVGAAILVVEVTEKPVDMFGRVDNRGTHARGPLEYLTSVTANNWLRMHEALTLTYAGAFQTRELQFYSATYRQVLTGEGLTFFANASYGLGYPDLGRDQEFLHYHTRSLYLESGLSYPIIRARERNLNIAAPDVRDRGPRHLLRPGGHAAEHARPAARLPPARGRRLRRLLGRHQPVLLRVQPGHRGPRQHPERQRSASRFNGRVDFTKMELRCRGCSRCSTASRSWPPSTGNTP